MGKKCRRFKTVPKLVCRDFRGGRKGIRGQPGKVCVRQTRRKSVRVCADFGKKGHGKLPRVTRQRIRRSIKKEAFGGRGTFSSLKRCKREVDKQKRAGVPKALVIKRVNIIRTFNRCKSNPDTRICRIANPCLRHAQR